MWTRNIGLFVAIVISMGLSACSGEQSSSPMPPTSGRVMSASETPPSSVFPIPRIDGGGHNWQPHRTQFPQSTYKLVKGQQVQVIELHGWLREGLKETGCEGENDSGPTWNYRFELDTGWAEQAGISLRDLFYPGDLNHQQDDPHVDTDNRVEGKPMIKMELTSWDPKLHTEPVPKGWELNSLCPKQSYWPFNPVNPLNLPEELQLDDYVRVVGSLISDAPHQTDGTHGGNRNDHWDISPTNKSPKEDDPNNPARWTEIHSPDLIEAIDKRVPLETVRGLTLHSNCFAPLIDCDIVGMTEIIQPPGPKPAWAKSVGVKEAILFGTNYKTIVEGNETRTGANITHEGDAVNIRIAVQGVPPFTAEPGKFAAIYRVFWSPNPPPSNQPLPICDSLRHRLVTIDASIDDLNAKYDSTENRKLLDPQRKRLEDNRARTEDEITKNNC